MPASSFVILMKWKSFSYHPLIAGFQADIPAELPKQSLKQRESVDCKKHLRTTSMFSPDELVSYVVLKKIFVHSQQLV